MNTAATQSLYYEAMDTWMHLAGAWLVFVLVGWSVFLLHLAMAPFTSFFCLKNQRGTSRIAWLIAILGIPALGSIYYMVLSWREQEEQEQQPPGAFRPSEDYRTSKKGKAELINDVLAGRNRST